MDLFLIVAAQVQQRGRQLSCCTQRSQVVSILIELQHSAPVILNEEGASRMMMVLLLSDWLQADQTAKLHSFTVSC